MSISSSDRIEAAFETISELRDQIDDLTEYENCLDNLADYFPREMTCERRMDGGLRSKINVDKVEDCISEMLDMYLDRYLHYGKPANYLRSLSKNKIIAKVVDTNTTSS